MTGKQFADKYKNKLVRLINTGSSFYSGAARVIGYVEHRNCVEIQIVGRDVNNYFAADHLEPIINKPLPLPG